MGKKIEKPAVVEPVKAASKIVKPAAKAASPIAPVKAVVTKKPVAKAAISAPKAKTAAKSAPTHAEIQTQAYFVAQRRMANGLPGDAASDWIQAEKELLAGK